jgi:hypothetical protein
MLRNARTRAHTHTQYAFGIMVYEIFSRTEPYVGEVMLCALLLQLLAEGSIASLS